MKHNLNNASNTKMNKVLIIQVCTGLVLVVLLILLFFWLKDGFMGYTPQEPSVQYINGSKLDNSENTSFSKEEDKVVIKDGETENAISNQPILFEINHDDNKNNKKDNNEGETIGAVKLKKLAISTDMMYSNPEYINQPAYRLTYFTTIESIGENIKIANEGKSAVVAGGYLYDGGDLYIFLEDTKLMIGTKEIDLAPLSYAKVSYRNYMEYYNAKDGDYLFFAQNNLPVIAYIGDKYSIDLSTDVIIQDDKESLIYTGIEKLNVMELK